MNPPEKLRGLRIATFESRRAKEIAQMIRQHGAEPISAPALREVPLAENGPAVEFARRLRDGYVDVVILLTGVGTRFLTEAVAAVLPRDSLARALAATVTVARGPKPITALRELGVTPTISVPEPNTWRELLTAIDERLDLSAKRVAIQEYGEENPELLSGLAQRGAEVLRVPIYRWALPEDLEPLRAAIREILADKVDIALFTTATQVRHLFQVAGTDQSSDLRAAFSRVVVASIGPISSDAITEFGIRVDLVPDHPKMGSLISAVAEHGRSLVEAKRRQAH